MGLLNSEWRREFEEDTELDEEALKETEDAIVAVSRKIEKYSSPAWTEVFEELAAEQKQAFKVMMSTDDNELLLAARAKARTIEGIRGRKEAAERELSELSRHRQILAGEIDEEE